MINRRVLWEHDYSNDYLTFVAREDNTRFTFYRGALANIDSIQCSTNGGNTWVSLSFTNNIATSPEINANEKILWKGIGLGTCNEYWQNGGDASYFKTLNDETFDVEGNIMSLLYCDNFKDQNEFPNLNNNAYNFMFLFSNDSSEENGTNVVNAKNLILPITTLTSQCYQYMFRKCTSLITAPEKLPAITLANYCYQGMFFGCPSLITAPELPATTLANYCYSQMFSGCTSLETAPELPAIELVNGCYSQMFYGCSSLNYINALFITTPPGSTYTNNWVYDVANYGLFVTSKYINWDPADYCSADGIPINWIISKGNQNNQNIEPPYEEINSNNYITITNATSVTLNKLSSHQTLYISKDHVNWVRMKMYKSYITDGDPVYMCGMLTRDNSLTNYTNIKFTGSNISISGNCNSIWNYININASLKKYCGYGLFSGNPIKSCPELPSTELSQGCYGYMFYGCTELTSPSKLPATSLVNECYQGMFSRCTSLVKAPKLPALLLVTDCYKEMFCGCSSLNCVEALFRTTPDSTYTQYWLDNVSNTGYFANKDEQTWFNTITRSADTIPSGWNFVTGYEAQYCTLVAIQKITVDWQGAGSLLYSIDDGNTWLDINGKTFDAGTRILIKGSGGLGGGGNRGELSVSSTFDVEGNVMSAVWGDNFIGKYEFPSFTPGRMFNNCTRLRNAENLILPATTLTTGCYYQMFMGCGQLTKAPKLPALTLVDTCYKEMFKNCNNLQYVTCLATNISASNCTTDWMYNAGASIPGAKIFTKNSSMSSWPRTNSGVPPSWTIEAVLLYITYEASSKLPETTSSSSSGLHTNAFTDANENTLTIASHTFENGVGTIKFSGDVVGIGDYAFYRCSGLTSITIPSGITSIGSRAFYYCYSLTSITIPNSVTSIGSNAFNNCYSLTSITIPSNITSIDSDVFRYSGLTSITIPSSVTSIGSSAFYGCHSLTSVMIGSSVTTINDNAFADCDDLASITIPNSVTTIDSNAFWNCYSLTSVTIGSGVTWIGLCAFDDCPGLESITVNSNNTIYDSRNNCNAIIETSSNTLIQGCKNTVIPDTVTWIGDYAFDNCSDLTSITIPDSVTLIDYQAFGYCSGLTSITIPDSVTSIDDNAFYECDNLTSITSNATTAPTIGGTTFHNIKTGGTLYVPSGSSGYDAWMSTDSYYLGKYNWTKVEQ